MNLVPLTDLVATEDALCYRLSRPDRDGVGPDLWFATTVADWANGRAQDAVQVCRQCPCRLACLRIAVRDDQGCGIWGGFDFGNPAEKRRARKFARKAA